MPVLFRFQSSRFDPAVEERNPINPIPGQALLKWLAGELQTLGYEPTEIGPEDWGWFLRVAVDGGRYLVGASGESSEDGGMCWTLLVQRRRTFGEWFRRVDVHGMDTPLLAAIQRLLREQADFSEHELESDP